jgi:hypothetical protein
VCAFSRRRFAPQDVKVEFTECRSVAHVLVHHFPAGRASVDVDGETTELIDLEIYQNFPHWQPVLRFFGIKMNYCDRGLGSLLLSKLLDDFAMRGVRYVWGDMRGDPDRLSAFYRRHGFRVDEARGRIELDLCPSAAQSDSA